jgi:DNA-binding transcriptional LysR family regulator
MELDERLFEGLDLNSLLTLLIVYEELGVTRAAHRLKIKQPAVSNTLARLRCRFHDPLFERHARGLRPTPRATELIHRLAPALMEIQQVLSDTVPIHSTRINE